MRNFGLRTTLILPLVLAPFLAACSSTPKEPSRFLEKSFEAKKDSQRHLHALDQLCSRNEGESNEFCVEAIKVRSSLGQKEGLAEKAADYCLTGNAESCLLWVNLAGDSGDPRLARDTLANACEERDSKYCPYATRIEHRIGSIQEALKRARKGCTSGVPYSCHDLGVLSIQQGDPGQAAVSLQKACQEGIGQACLERILVARIQGKDMQDALEASCEETRNPLTCDLATIGTEKKADPRWQTRTEALCKKGSARDCFLATLDQYYRPGGKNLARFRFGSQCSETDGSDSCFMKLQIENPLGLRETHSEEVKRHCQSGSRHACYAIESSTGLPAPTVQARKVLPAELADSCEKERYPESCEEKARQTFAAGDPGTAHHFMGRACEFGSEDSCSWLAQQLLEKKELTSEDIQKAKDLFGKACRSGSVLGCERRLKLSEKNSGAS